MKRTVITACACVLSAGLSAQDTSLKARELFYTPPPDPAAAQKAPVKKSIPARTPATKQTTVPVVTAANVPLGIRYSVLLRGPEGHFAEVNADSTFRSGDAIRLNVDSNSDGYLYIIAQGSSGVWKPLFPSPEAGGGSNRIEKGSSQQIPAADKKPLMFDDQTGTEKIFLVLSRKPEQNLDKLIYSITGTSTQDRTLMAQASVSNDVVNRLREEVKSRDLVFEQVSEQSFDRTDGKHLGGEHATYVVNPNRTDDARLVVDVALKHGK